VNVGHDKHSVIAVGLVAIALVASIPACGGGRAANSEPAAAAAVTSVGSPSVPPADDAPSGSAATAAPMGFAAAVTGGAGGEEVTVSTPDQLVHELCRTTGSAGCTDNAPRTIKIASTIDFSSASLVPVAGCLTPNAAAPDKVCPAPKQREIMLTAQDWQKPYCEGQPTSTYAYDPVGTGGIRVGSNKTLLGVGASAGIKGRGLLLKQGVANVIIRNLSITDINEGKVWGGDALTITDASGVWIDHNRFARIGRQFLVTGDGSANPKVDNLTISNNEFDGRSGYSIDCNGRHYWNILLYGNGRVTMVGNWLHDFDGRAPKIVSLDTGAIVQVVNNLFENSGGHALDYEGDPTRVLLEGNQFLDVPLPIAGSGDPAHRGQLFGFYEHTAATTAACNAALGRPCNANLASPAPTARNNHIIQDGGAIDAMKSEATRIVTPYPTADVPATVRARAGVGKI
jgi:pectate lyase